MSTTADPTNPIAHADPQAQDAGGRRRIVVGVDGSDRSLNALRRAVRIATAMHADIDAITTWRFPVGYAGVAETYSPEHDAQLILAQAGEAVFGEHPPPWFTSHTVEGNADEVLIDQSGDAEMLIVGSRGHSGIVGVLLGSVSSACAEHARCPVLIMH